MKTATLLVVLSALSASGELTEILSLGCKLLNPLRQKIINDTVTIDKMKVHYYNRGTHEGTFPLVNATNMLTTHPTFGGSPLYLVIFSPDFMESATSNSTLDLAIRMSYLGFHFLMLDYGDFYSGPDYVYVAGSARRVADLLFSFISGLYQKGVSLNLSTLIGEGIGAQVSSFAARQFKASYNKTWHRITALDPAAPCFLGAGYLSTLDADYVEVVHTSRLSYTTTVGLAHAQWFVNNPANTQPGCGWMPVADLLCSRSRAKLVYTEGLNLWNPIRGKVCRDWMAINCDLQPVPLYPTENLQPYGYVFVRTKAASPFNMGVNGYNFTGV